MSRVYNFSAGPSTLPTEVLERISNELLDWNNLGISILEIGHRTKPFAELAEKIELDFRDLLRIPENYKVLFLQGGGRSQFSMIPMNLLRQKDSADYIDTGVWSSLAIKEAERYCKVNIVASSKENNYDRIPELEDWNINPHAAYFYYTDNETVNGVEFPNLPQHITTPLVSDMSSNILSREFDINKFGLIYAGAQKNVAIAGLTIVIVNESLLGDALAITPTMYNFKIHSEHNSMYNTPPIFAWYVAGLVFEWLKKEGGVSEMEKRNQRKSNKLYDYIDNSGFYFNAVQKKARSRMNVIFNLSDDSLNDLFLTESLNAGLAFLKGHKLVGGMRASIYNAMPESGVDSLISFMSDFAKRYG